MLYNLVEWILQELIELEFNEKTGVERCEKSEERQGFRNGFRKRDLFTWVGRIILRVPRDREPYPYLVVDARIHNAVLPEMNM